VAGSDDPSGNGEVGPPKPGEQAECSAPARATVMRQDQHSSPAAHYLTGRAASRAASIAGLRKVGMMSAALSTVGLSLLRKRGREGAGAALLAAAAGHVVGGPSMAGA